MQTEISFLAAFIVGLLGGVHCLGMCGGIVGALTLGIHESTGAAQMRLFRFQLAYNAGRILSYSFAGAIAGLLGYLALDLTGVNHVQLWLQIIAGMFMLALGLYLGGWWKGLAHLERMGSVVWKRVQPLGKQLIPVQTARHAFLLGLVWGWLPCGLVYSVLIWSFSSGGMQQGFLLMLGFGLGTLPNLLLIGVFAARIGKWVKTPLIQSIAGLMVMLLGGYMLWSAVSVWY